LLAVSLGAHLILVAAMLCLAAAFNISIAAGDALVIFPMVLLVSSLPVTPGGWGVREGAMALALAPLGVPIEASVSVSVTYGVLAICACIPSVLMYLTLRETTQL
jgi:hypothetical protein